MLDAYFCRDKIRVSDLCPYPSAILVRARLSSEVDQDSGIQNKATCQCQKGWVF